MLYKFVGFQCPSAYLSCQQLRKQAGANLCQAQANFLLSLFVLANLKLCKSEVFQVCSFNEVCQLM